MNSREQTDVREWKTLLLEAKKLTKQIGVFVYRRTKLLVQIFEDAEFRAEVGARDDLEAAGWLDAEFKGTALAFLQLRAILAKYPEEKAWKDGDLQKMFDNVKPETVEGETPRTRTVVKLAEYKRACDDREHYKTRSEYLEERIVELERERAEHRQTIARLQKQLEELTKMQPV